MMIVATFEVDEHMANKHTFDLWDIFQKVESSGVKLCEYEEIDPDEDVRFVTSNGELELL